MHIPQIVKIKRIINETKTIKTFIFDWKVNDEVPGQFMMLWNFKDEKPMSMSLIDPVNNEIGFSIRKVGPFTKAIHQMDVDEMIGLRGPYGRGFEITGSRILAVGGGIGIAPVAAFSEEATRRGLKVDLICAAATKDELIFRDRFKNNGINYKPCTDDGSYGFGGFGTELAQEILQNNDYDMLICCGPEVMLKKLADLADEHQISAQFSLERYMKCGVGICGHCCVDDVGWRICKEGPVFWRDEVRLIKEFGKYRRDAAGIKKTI